MTEYANRKFTAAVEIVSASRAKERCTIYTDDKDALLSSVQRSGVRMAATELAAEPKPEPARRDLLKEQVERLCRYASLAKAYASEKLDDMARGIGKIREHQRGMER